MLENEFDIKMEGDRKELLKSMCNLSQGIKEQGIEQGRREERISTLVTFFKNDGTVAAAKQMLNSSDEDIKIAIKKRAGRRMGSSPAQIYTRSKVYTLRR